MESGLSDSGVGTVAICQERSLESYGDLANDSPATDLVQATQVTKIRKLPPSSAKRASNIAAGSAPAMTRRHCARWHQAKRARCPAHPVFLGLREDNKAGEVTGEDRKQ